MKQVHFIDLAVIGIVYISGMICTLGSPAVATEAPSKHVLATVPKDAPTDRPAAAQVSPVAPEVQLAGPTPRSLPSLTPLQSKQLSKEFVQALRTELKALEHRQRFEFKELRASQSARLKEWQKQQNVERRKYFIENPHGPDRRAYVQDLMRRRKAFIAMMKSEEKQRVQEQLVRAQALKNDQVSRLKEFEEALKKNEVPPNRLWPQPGH
ncbi:MAG: hypothetical protein A2070_01710 [Bdellovibrionales bacterium GWC1_52_8]|nr:MAG: hypothetical protein A2X97_15385 [Bdellovibrionales bacterium GWA1_52_35]OFZ37977.1 MAG: hypothetical protein A2070_01710 [Bdellovibrionales bacterium GWC1_52_8]HCM40520.1 hypothetical protein [Bdellovibrionales bacterium]